MKNEFDFLAQMLNFLYKNTINDKISYSDSVNWHMEYPHHRLNFYNDIPISQVLGIYNLFNKEYFKDFSTIIEIGTYNGGLSSYVFDSKNDECKFVTYDIDGEINIAKNKRNDIDFRIGDCFEEKQFNEIIDLIKRKDKTLLICDGGDKVQEFNLFSKYLKIGDVVIIHDYKHDTSNDLWNQICEFWQWPYGHQSSYEDIKHSIFENGLEEYKNKESNFFLWGSFVKK
jgi:cephalosporin hydroxylase